ncbi:MAG: sugar phosphate isomerase/epimerase family protein [Candidatus Methanofastidiosia archaeon]
MTHDYEKIKESVAKTSADRIEIIIYDKYINDTHFVFRAFENFDIPVSAIHAPKKVQTFISTPGQEHLAESIIKKNVELAKQLGADIVVVHAWEGILPHLKFKNIVSTIKRVSEFAAKNNISISVEVVPSRFLNPILLIERILDKSPLSTFTLDFEYAFLYNIFDKLLLLSDRLTNVHLRDYDGRWLDGGRRIYLKPGDGIIDFPKYIKKIKEQGYDSFFTIEAPYAVTQNLEESIKMFRCII